MGEGGARCSAEKGEWREGGRDVCERNEREGEKKEALEVQSGINKSLKRENEMEGGGGGVCTHPLPLPPPTHTHIHSDML